MDTEASVGVGSGSDNLNENSESVGVGSGSDNFNENEDEGSSTEEIKDKEEEQQQQQDEEEEETEKNVEINPRTSEITKRLRKMDRRSESLKTRIQKHDLSRAELKKSCSDYSAELTATTKRIDQLDREGKNFATQYRKVVIEHNAVWSKTSDRIKMIEAEGIFPPDSTSPPISIECLPSGTTSCLKNAASTNAEEIGINVPQIREKFCEMLVEFDSCVVKGRNNKLEVGELNKKKDDLERKLDDLNQKVEETDEEFVHNLLSEISSESLNQKSIQVELELAMPSEIERELREELLAKNEENLSLKRKIEELDESNQAPRKRHSSKKTHAAEPAKDKATVAQPVIDLEEDAEDGKTKCSICGRKFTNRTLSRHQETCGKKWKYSPDDSERRGSKSDPTKKLTNDTVVSIAMETMNQTLGNQEKK